jgi:tripartite-type tricarboxylate transporter receptor subunit TctC
MTKGGKLMFAWLLFGFLTVWASGLAAQTYPSKPITLIVPYSPGGGTDVLARTVAQKLSANWGQPVIVENRPGANGMIGSGSVAKAAPDGYTLAMVVSTHAINPSLYRKVPYDTVKAFAPVTLVAASPFVLVVSPSSPAKTLKEFIALAKSKPGELSWGSSEGSTQLAGELFATLAGVKMIHVPYKGGAPLMTDLLGGHVSMGSTSAVTVLPHVRSGKLHVLVAGSEKRSTALPDVPTGAEAGLPGFVANAWYGILAPAGTPADTVTKLQQEIARILETSEVKERFAQQGAEPIGNTPDEFDAFIKSEVAKWAKVVQDAGISPE